MRFNAEHHFAGTVDALATLLLDPAFHTGLQLPDVSLPVVVDETRQGDEDVLRLRYEYTGQLDSMARRVIGGRTITWVQELRLDRATGTGTLSFSADDDGGRVNGEASVTITATDGDGSHRRIAGDFHIRIPVVGGTAERKIVPGLVRRLDVEAAALSDRLGAGS